MISCENQQSKNASCGFVLPPGSNFNQLNNLLRSRRVIKRRLHNSSKLRMHNQGNYKVYQQATGTMILLVYVGSIQRSNRLHKCNEEYRGRNRHNVESFLRRCTIFRLAKPAFFRYSVNFTLHVCYVACYRKYVKLFDSVN